MEILLNTWYFRLAQKKLQKKITRKASNDKVQEEIINKNLFARMLALSSQHKIDIAEVLKYPLTATPRAFSHSDGTFNKTDKSALMNHLEKTIVAENPGSIDVAIIDGFFLLHTIGEVPRTLGLISRKFLQMVTKYKAKHIHVIFDQYFNPSIKDAERQRRVQHLEQQVYAIRGADQIKPSNFINCLRSNEFKENFVKFIINHWQDPSISDFFKNKTVYVNDKNTCYQFTSSNNTIIRAISDDYSCNHEEADTRILYVISKFQSPNNIVVRCNDTDVLVILLGNFHKINAESKILMEVGFYNNNSLRYLDVGKLFVELGPDVCLALPGLHAFTGCDTTSCFYKKGKVTPFKQMEKSSEFQKYFQTFYQDPEPDSVPITTAEKFVCFMYNLPRCPTVNEARYRKFEMAYKPRKMNEPLIKSFATFDSLSIPPCQSSLLLHVKRSIFQTYIWMNAEKQDPMQPLNPEDYGWKIGPSGIYEPVWFDGDVAPPVVIDAIAEASGMLNTI